MSKFLSVTPNKEDLKAILRGKGCDPEMLCTVELSFICKSNKNASKQIKIEISK